MPSVSALNPFRVVEIGTSIPVAACGRQFARWGAQVVATKADRDGEDGVVALLWESLHSNKQTIDAALPPEWVAAADVLLVDRPLGELGLEEADGRCPVVVDISPYGRTGEYAGLPGNPFTVEAMSGFMSLQGEPDKAPLRMPGHILAKACGVAAFNAALAALMRYIRSGKRERVEVSCMQVLATIVPTLRTQLDEAEKRTGGPAGGVRLYQFGDSYLSFNFSLGSALSSLLDIIGLDDSRIPANLATSRDRQDLESLRAFVEQLPSPFDAHDLFKIISEPPHSSAVGKVLKPAQTTTDEQLTQLGYWQAQQHPDFGVLQRTGPPARLSRTPAAETSVPGAFQGWSGERFEPGNEAISAPLSGFRILDLTQAWIGPYASQVLSDLGAECIKIESMDKPDVWRRLPPKKPPHIVNPNAKLVNCSPNFNSVNRDKRSLTLDLASEEGKRLFLELVKTADVIMENYRPLVLPKLGLDYETIRQVNPEIVMTSFSAYGETGPYADYRGNGTTIEAISGWDSLFGYEDGPPMVMGFYQADAITGLQMAATTLVALLYRQRTGKGQQVRGSMFETAVDYIEEYVLLEQLSGEAPRFGNRSAAQHPQGVYRCQGGDRWLAISVETDQQWRALCNLLDSLDSLDSRWSAAERRDHYPEIDDAISSWTAERTAPKAAETLLAHGIPAAPVQTTDEVLADPHLESINWWHTLPHPDLGSLRYAGLPYRFSSSVLKSTRASPRLGQHSREILTSEFGLSALEIKELIDNGVTGEEW